MTVAQLIERLSQLPDQGSPILFDDGEDLYEPDIFVYEGEEDDDLEPYFIIAGDPR